jgi:GntR family transcriptional regulator/MocR family aminotransferase
MNIHVSLAGRDDLTGEIYRQLRRAILDGRLRPGDPLPPTREFARRLSVARATVTLAYERLAGEGYVSARVGAGTFVSRSVSRPTGGVRARAAGVLRARPVWSTIPIPSIFDRPARFDFRSGVPDGSLFPHRTWGRLVMRELRAPSLPPGVYTHPAGHRALREAIARHLGVSRGMHV